MSRREFAARAGIAAAGLIASPIALHAQDSASGFREMKRGLAKLFAQQGELIHARRTDWLAAAAASTPKLLRTPKKQVSTIRVVQDKSAFQGWAAQSAGTVESICNKPMLPGDSFILDFGEHLTGYFSFSVRHFDIPVDAPIRLSLVFGEVLSEIAEPLDPYTGDLARSWMQDEVINIDECPAVVQLPRRYAFRYVKVTVVSASRHGKFGFTSLNADAVSCADPSRLGSYTPKTPEEAALDRVALATLRDCMQTVFEDGPKRDRRLWLGDLRLQAHANYVTYRNYDLVKRSLYILSGTSDDKGLVSTCAFERPSPVRGGDCILDYTALFAPTVLDYLKASGDTKTALDLWPLALKQLDFTLEHFDDDGLFVPPKDWWQFVDWKSNLDKQASEHAIILYGTRATLELGTLLGKTEEVQFLPALISKIVTAARKSLWNPALGMFVSGGSRQISWASQAWMVLAGVPDAEQGKAALVKALQYPGAVQPGSPYLYHHVVEALYEARLASEALQLLNSYWGGMVRKGADTFWEIRVPENDFESPYKSHLINSYCHAWSCTPTYFLRRKA